MDRYGVAELRDDRRSAVFLESPLNPPMLGDFKCLVPPDLGARGQIHPYFQQRPILAFWLDTSRAELGSKAIGSLL